MQFLVKDLPIYTVTLGDSIHTFQWDEVEHDEYEGPMAKVYGEYFAATATDERPAKWWTVGVYTRTPAYGGPEEGGWYYDAGELTEHGRMRFFDDYAAAKAYADTLWSWVDNENKERKGWDEKLTVRCTTEAQPHAYYPRKRPHYS